MTTRIPLCHPEISEAAISAVSETLRTRWIGQGPKVDEFEATFRQSIDLPHSAVAVGAGTDALHLAYILAGLGPGDEAIVPVLTCAATNIPLLYQRAQIRFADVQADTFNIDPAHVRALVTERTKAIVCVDFAGLPCDLAELREIADDCGVPLIEDAAQALGATYRGQSVGALADYAIFSFQAVKNLTTGDGGMLMLRDAAQTDRARRLRWFGIDRAARFDDRWLNDIDEIGYKYQMTDIAASLGLAGLQSLQTTLEHRRNLFEAYRLGLANVAGIELVGAKRLFDREHAACNCTIVLDDVAGLRRRLAEADVEAGVMHQRNDRYSIFAGCGGDFPVMDSLEGRYLMLPLHTRMTEEDVERICDVVRR
jgi:dTDP-4-amino-4,6-dideoxygalactose transaminase